MRVFTGFVWLCFVSFGFCSEKFRIRKARDVCQYGTYQREGGRVCCLCSTGFYVKSDCNASNQTDCVKCDPGTYQSHPNSDRTCRLCSVCNSNANMIEDEKCTINSDTVCTCQDDFYCKRSPCKACDPCDSCEEYGILSECTSYNNTMCNPDQSNAPVLVGLVFAFLCLLGIGTLFMLHKKKKLCFQVNKQSDPEFPSSELQELVPKKLKDVDLNPYLAKIVDCMTFSEMKDFVRHTNMSSVKIDDLTCDVSPNDVKEQKYSLFQAWYQHHGLKGAYPTLIKTLREMKANAIADTIRNVVESGQSTKQQEEEV